VKQRLLLTSLWILVGLPAIYGQEIEPMTAQRITEIQRSAVGVIQSLGDVMARLGNDQHSMAENESIRSNLTLHSFSSQQVMLYNDLEKRGRKTLPVSDYLRKLSYSGAGLQVRYESIEPSPIFYDTKERRYVMYVKVLRVLSGAHRTEGQRLDQSPLYFFLENLKSTPLIYGSAAEVGVFFEEVPVMDNDWMGKDQPTFAIEIDESFGEVKLNRSPPEEEPMMPSCTLVQAEAQRFIQQMVQRDATEINHGDLLRLDQLGSRLQQQCARKERRTLDKHLETLSKDIASAKEAELAANRLSSELRKKKLAQLSRRRLNQYLRQVQRTSEDLIPRLIQQPEQLVDRKAEEYRTLSDWHRSAVRHPHLNLKVGIGGGVFVPNLSFPQVQANYPALYRHLWNVQLGYRFNRLARAPRTPDPKTGKRNLKRAHLLILAYRQTYAGIDPFGYQGTYNPYQVRNTQFQEIEVGMVWWEWWRMSAGIGQQWNGAIGESTQQLYYSATSAISIRMFRFLELDLGCTGMWADFLPSPTLRPELGVSMVVKL
jgi:hypothetical protein